MSDNDQPPSRWAARTAFTAAAVLAGVVFGFAMFWLGNLGPVEWNGAALVEVGELALVALATAAGILTAFVKSHASLVTVGVTAMLLTSTMIGQVAWSDPVLGFMIGIACAFCFIIAMLAVTVLRARRSYVRRGWDLAFAEAREHDARVEQAVTREREAMAGEIHDGLGHRLTLIAVQAARLSLDEELPAQTRAELQRIRENAAAASEELGETVTLLAERDSGATASLSGLGVEDVIERARSSGVAVHSAVAPDMEAGVNDYTHATLLRVMQEGLTNAAKHAPGAEVHIVIDIVGHEVMLEMRNPASPTASSARSGHGIVALRHRVEILGGTLEVEQDEDFALTMRLPRAAMPSTTAVDLGPSRVGVLAAEAAGAERRRRRATRQTRLVPLAMLLVLILLGIGIGYFVYATVASVLPPERFAAIEVGDAQAETERLLPPTEMLDAPRSALPEPAGSTCRYYEPSISFFERDDVYRVCFAHDQVVSTDTIPPS